MRLNLLQRDSTASLNIIFALLILSLLGCSKDNGANDWQVSHENYDKSLIEELRQRVDKNDFKSITSVIVIKNEKLLIEEYFNNSTLEDLHDVRSVGKTFASAIVGIAIGDHYIKDENQRLTDFYEIQNYNHFSEAKAGVTLKNLLTMSSGFDGDDNVSFSPGNEENMYDRDNWIDWTLNLPMASDRDPGDSCVYFTAGVVLIGDIVDKSVPAGLEDYADGKLFNPMGIYQYKWQYTPQDVPSTAGGIRLTSRDLAKFGQLYLSGGIWKGKQIVPKQWVEKSLKQYYKISDTDHYGFLWWSKGYKIGERTLNTFYCSGNGGNKIFIFQNMNLVVVITSEAYNQKYAHSQIDDMMINYILPSVLF